MEQGKLIWITGLAGSGKTTIGKQVYFNLKKKNPSTVFLDGDSFREIMGSSQGHSREQRFIVAFQISRLCKFLIDQNINVVCATISLFKEVHRFNREQIQNYFEIYIHCSMDELINRDQKGIYSKALKGELLDVVGIDITFDQPINCDLKIDNTEKIELDTKVKQILQLINNE